MPLFNLILVLFKALSQLILLYIQCSLYWIPFAYKSYKYSYLVLETILLLIAFNRPTIVLSFIRINHFSNQSLDISNDYLSHFVHRNN